MESSARPGALERRRLRRRLDRQERVREALLLDLGAIIFELHRQSRREPELLQSKASELRAVDDEVRGLADALEEGHGLPALTARGLVTTCTACGALMGTRDRYCPSCGAAAGESVARNDAAEPEQLMEEPDFGETREVAPVNGDGPHEAETAPPGAPPATPREQALVPRAQRRLRAGRRMARQWLEQRRPDGP